jgi:hypothetical protein
MAAKKTAPAAEALGRMSAKEVIAVLTDHWLMLSKPERDDYMHVLLEHPERVAIFDDVFRRAARSEVAGRKGRH